LKKLNKKKRYKPKVFDFRAQAKNKLQPDGTVLFTKPANNGYIDLRDTVILDPIL